MSREILFRGKAKTGLHAGKFIYGFYVKDFWRPRKGYGILPIDEEQGGYIEVDPETVGQYIGLRDCKRRKEYPEGQMIFEGDICRFREWNNGDMCWVGKVHYEHQQFVISGGKNKECDSPFTLVMSRFISENIEVIGNIHDNPELLY